MRNVECEMAEPASQDAETSNSPFPIADEVRQPSGFALVIILGIIVLMAALAIGFLSSTGTERAAATGFQAAVSTRHLADTAVSLVQGQINIASTQGAAVAWASQPGMVRTFNNTDGGLINAYKLYSAPDMISSSVSLVADKPPDTWGSDTAIWTDLNSPVEVNGVKNYPVLDPSSLSLPLAQQPEGFAITSAPGVTATSYQTAPMPVRWLYMLSDGQIIAPSETTGTTATVPGATDAKGSNPIVGRMAFWTDDETCKVNINTASEGTYWDAPRAVAVGNAATGSSPGDQYECGYAEYPPVQKEFQRYPGHPATTCLSTVFPWLTKDQLYGIVPRVQSGGSNAGTTMGNATISPDTDRLYANLDELMFKPDRTVNAAGLTKAQIEEAKFCLTARSRAPETNLFNLPRIAMWPIYSLGATGTPDTNYTTPFDRLIAFCASTGTIGSSSYHPYIFQRQNASSTTNDIGLSRNVELLSYLTYLTGQATPGFGGNFLTKYPLDRDQILTETFDYIRSANLQDDTLPKPAPPTTPTNRFTTSLAQIITWTEADKIHFAPAGYGWVAPSTRGAGATQTLGFGRSFTLSEVSLVFICNAAPDDPATAGVDESFGSNIPKQADNPLTPLVDESQLPGNTVLGMPVGTALVPGEKYIQAMILPELFSAMQGFIDIIPNMQITISGLENLQINGQSLFPSGITASTAPCWWDAYDYNKMGGLPSYRIFGFGKGSPARGSLSGDSGSVYPFIGTPIKISAPPTGGNMSFTSTGPITVNIYQGASTACTTSNLIQSFTMTFPTSTFPVPEIAPTGVTGGGKPATTISTNSGKNWWAFSKIGCISPAIAAAGTDCGTTGRLAMIGGQVGSQCNNASGYGNGAFIRPEYDTIRSMLPAHGDYRLVAASPSVTTFVKHPKYDDVTKHMAASFAGTNLYMNQNGNDVGKQYISTVTYGDNGQIGIPSNYSGTTSPEITGDFDTGLAQSPDGPYVNKQDEGDVGVTGGTDYSFFPYFRVFVNNNAFVSVGTTFFSPNRQIPSSGMLGSLPTGVKAGVPWTTLLFRPQPTHPSYSTTIPDHLFMDLFWMPVVEPYPISDRFSTAGKINMNYQILPFTYIERSTGMRAALKAERLPAIPITKGIYYKGSGKNDTHTAISYRLPIDRDGTLTQFQTKFAAGQIFKSASEICDIHILPSKDGNGNAITKTVADMTSPTGFWADYALTGDNLREHIYTTLYPRLTTKSNTFTVHFRVQALQQAPSSIAGKWTEGKDKVLGEYRGATSIERFIDANNPLIPNYAATPSTIPNLDPLDKFYRWRIVENRQFAP